MDIDEEGRPPAAAGLGRGPRRGRQSCEPTSPRAAPCRSNHDTWARGGLAKGAVAMIYGEPETPRFLAAVRRLKRRQRKRERLTREAKQRVRAALRKMRDC